MAVPLQKKKQFEVPSKSFTDHLLHHELGKNSDKNSNTGESRVSELF